MTQLVLCDDHTVFLDALATVLSAQGFTISALVSNAAHAVEIVHHQQPDVCLLEPRFTNGTGVEMISQLRAAAPQTRIVILSGDPDTTMVNHALHLGAAGYIHKTSPVAALVTAIHKALHGETTVDTSPSRPIRRRRDTDAANHLARYLTTRERECLALLVDGHSTPEIARRLGISATTARTYVQTLLTKLGVHSQLEATAYAIRHALITQTNKPTTPPAPQQKAALG